MQSTDSSTSTSAKVSQQPSDEKWSRTLVRKRAVAEDGTGIAYEVVGTGERALVLANGLGGRLYAWEPLIEACWRDYRLITWDYRGLFDSDTPASPRRLAVAHHVEDAVTILKAESCERAVLFGWSMGVQVSLDVAATHPELVAGLVLLNGTYGQVLHSAFQPLLPVPFLPKSVHAFIEFLRKRRAALELLRSAARLVELPTVLALTLTAGRRSMRLRPALRRYLDDVLGPSFQNYMFLFQELDAHSVYHLLPDIEAPALVVSGALDVLTPSYQSREMARRLPNAQRLALWRATHFSLLERPDVVVPAIRAFIEREALW